MKTPEEIGKDFEKEFGTRSDYFNHRLGLFLEMKDWFTTKYQLNTADLQAEIAALKAEREWISVKDRLPEPYISVLTYSPKEQIKYTVDYYVEYTIWGERTDVTNWQPLPSPPKEPQ